jgi:hypothetical protein
MRSSDRWIGIRGLLDSVEFVNARFKVANDCVDLGNASPRICERIAQHDEVVMGSANRPRFSTLDECLR